MVVLLNPLPTLFPDALEAIVQAKTFHPVNVAAADAATFRVETERRAKQKSEDVDDERLLETNIARSDATGG